jgi:serine/threonine protein phosphatase PrpC
MPTRDGGLLMLVCDGMGGMGRGDQASRLAVDVLATAFDESEAAPAERIQGAIDVADRAIRDALCAGGQGWAGSTAVVAYVKDGVAHVGWAGDSRVYLMRGGTVIARTKDHKLVQDLIDSGQLTDEEARRSSLSSVITRALGGRPPEAAALTASLIEPSWVLENGDRILLCSDGLADLVEDDEVPGLLAPERLEATAEGLIGIANARGGHDNITVVVASFDETTPDPVDVPRIGGAAAMPPDEEPPPRVPIGVDLRAVTDPGPPEPGDLAPPPRKSTPPPDPDADANAEAGAVPPMAVVALVIVLVCISAWLVVYAARG